MSETIEFVKTVEDDISMPFHDLMNAPKGVSWEIVQITDSNNEYFVAVLNLKGKEGDKEKIATYIANQDTRVFDMLCVSLFDKDDLDKVDKTLNAIYKMIAAHFSDSFELCHVKVKARSV